MTETEILERLAGTFRQEGVEFDVLGRDGLRLLVRARRSGPGVPVAFLVKALEGTLKRYHPELREVELVEYDPGEGSSTPEQSSPEFDKVLKHRANAAALTSLPQAPGLVLSGCDRAQAIQAVEQAHKMWARQGVHYFKIRGYSEEAVQRAVDKWLSFYGHARSWEREDDPDILRITLKSAPQGEFPESEVLWFPSRLMLIQSDG